MSYVRNETFDVKTFDVKTFDVKTIIKTIQLRN